MPSLKRSSNNCLMVFSGVLQQGIDGAGLGSFRNGVHLRSKRGVTHLIGELKIRVA